jgi:hypothetical protein
MEEVGWRDDKCEGMRWRMMYEGGSYKEGIMKGMKGGGVEMEGGMEVGWRWSGDRRRYVEGVEWEG